MLQIDSFKIVYIRHVLNATILGTWRKTHASFIQLFKKSDLCYDLNCHEKVYDVTLL